MAYKSFSTGLANRMLGGASGGSFQTIFENAVIHCYSGAPPASADAAITGTLLGTVTVNGGAFAYGTPDNGLNFDDPVGRVIAKAVAEIWSLTGVANGVAGWARLSENNVDEDGGVSTELARVDVDIANSGATWLMVNTTIQSGAPMLIAAFHLTIRTS